MLIWSRRSAVVQIHGGEKCSSPYKCCFGISKSQSKQNYRSFLFGFGLIEHTVWVQPQNMAENSAGKYHCRGRSSAKKVKLQSYIFISSDGSIWWNTWRTCRKQFVYSMCFSSRKWNRLNIESTYNMEKSQKRKLEHWNTPSWGFIFIEFSCKIHYFM